MSAEDKGQIRIIIQSLHGMTARAVKVIVLDAVANLVEDTPWLTGWARANWIPKIGGFHEGAAGKAGAVEQETQERGKAEVLALYTLDKGFVSISNNVPYIQALNDGTSTKAPAGFVQAAILRAVQGARV